MKTTTSLKTLLQSSKTSLQKILLLATIAVTAIAFPIQVQAASLLNLDFGQGASTLKVGPAAIGQTPGDFWNFYTRDDGAGGWRTFGAMNNLKLADGTVTATGLTVQNAPGSWGTSSLDPMYVGYIYPFGGVATIKLTNLLAGTYDLLVYSYDGNYHLNVGGNDYGNKTCRDNFASGVPVWQEGKQYARFSNVGVGTGQDLTLTVQPGLDGYAIIAGLQLVAVPEPSVGAILLGAAVLGMIRKRARA